MKRRFSPRASGYRRQVLSAGAALAVCAAALVLFVLALIRIFAPGAISAIASPLWTGGLHLTASVGSALSLESRRSLIAERDTLRSEHAALTAQNAQLAARVADLETLVGGVRESGNGIAASVRVRPPMAPYDVLILDAGSEDGVQADAVVRGPGGTPVGSVSGVSAGSSRVTLYSTIGTATEGWVGVNRIPITLHGVGAGAFEASVPKEAGVVVGDGVYVPSGGSAPIGTVVAIDVDPSSPTTELRVRPYTNPFSLTWVTIVGE